MTEEKGIACKYLFQIKLSIEDFSVYFENDKICLEMYRISDEHQILNYVMSIAKFEEGIAIYVIGKM